MKNSSVWHPDAAVQIRTLVSSIIWNGFNGPCKIPRLKYRRQVPWGRVSIKNKNDIKNPFLSIGFRPLRFAWSHSECDLLSFLCLQIHIHISDSFLNWGVSSTKNKNQFCDLNSGFDLITPDFAWVNCLSSSINWLIVESINADDFQKSIYLHGVDIGQWSDAEWRTCSFLLLSAFHTRNTVHCVVRHAPSNTFTFEAFPLRTDDDDMLTLKQEQTELYPVFRFVDDARAFPISQTRWTVNGCCCWCFCVARMYTNNEISWTEGWMKSENIAWVFVDGCEQSKYV